MGKLEVYADVVFAINFAMDFFILFVTGKLARRRGALWRLACAALIMALSYCLLIFFTPFHKYLNIFAPVVMVMIGVTVAFKPRRVSEFVKLFGLCHVAAFAVGGIGMALFYYSNMGNMIGNIAGLAIKGFSLQMLIASVCGFYILIKLFSKWFNRVIVKKQQMLPVRIVCDGGDATMTALLDTGNTLHDPITQMPVVIAELSAVQAFLPERIKRLFAENNETNLTFLLTQLEGSSFVGRVRLIPFASLGAQNGMLLGFRPDGVEIASESGVIRCENVIIGIYNHALSTDGSYQGLMHPELLK